MSGEGDVTRLGAVELAQRIRGRKLGAAETRDVYKTIFFARIVNSKLVRH